MNRNIRMSAVAGLGAILLATLPLGCGGMTPADPDQARATLAMALDAWREGRSIDDVVNGTPPITVAEPKWKAGFKLSRYQVSDTARAAGFDLKIPVELWLENPKGKTIQEKAKYTVSIEPVRTVIRAPL
jgi:hypothetical protein